MNQRRLILKSFPAWVAGMGGCISVRKSGGQDETMEPAIKSESPTPTSTPTPTQTNTPEQILQVPNNADFARQTERLVLETVNAQRDSVGLSTIAWDDTLHRIALEMAESQNQIEASPKDRFQAAGLDCENEAIRDRYKYGGEIKLKTAVGRAVSVNYDTTDKYDNTEELAKGIYLQWDHDDHTGPYLSRSFWETAGVGIWIEENDSVYAVMGFC